MGDNLEAKVLIGIPTTEITRFGRFYDYMALLWKGKDTKVMYSRGQSPARNRNIIIEYALAKDYTHIFFVDDDIALPEDALMKLLNHDKDMVTGLYMMRSYPHQPIAFDIAQTDGACAFADLQDESLIPVVAAGLGCCLIKTDVFRSMERPWITLGEFEKDHWNDDLSFFHRTRQAGWQLYLDPTIKCGHMWTVTIVPNFIDGKWYVSYDTMGTKSITFPLEPVRELVEK